MKRITSEDDNQEMWMTPKHSSEQTFLQALWTSNPNTTPGNQRASNIPQPRARGQEYYMSLSAGDNIAMQDSGIEST
jgi:hypothetical protein